MTRRTTAYINLTAIRENLTQLKAFSPSSKTIAVVKANAYGNGAIAVSKHIDSDIDMFAVAILSEAHELRAAGITSPILVLQGPHEQSELASTFSHDLHWIIHNETQLAWLNETRDAPIAYAKRLWLKFDSGMHRLGFAIEDFDRILSENSQWISKDTIIATHLACADENDPSHTNKQLSAFLQAVEKSGLGLSIANSAGAIAHESARQQYNRLGIALYGSSPFNLDNRQVTLAPVMTLRSTIIALRNIPAGDTVGYGGIWRAKRPSVIATIALGYADGYPRHAPIGTPAICRGQRILLVGRVSMDMLTFDVTDLESVALNDEVELWGQQLPINEVADFVDTIGYELMTRVSARVPRQYIQTEGSAMRDTALRTELDTTPDATTNTMIDKVPSNKEQPTSD